MQGRSGTGRAGTGDQATGGECSLGSRRAGEASEQVSRRAGVELESRRAVERSKLGELALQGERSLGTGGRNLQSGLGAAGAGKPSRRTWW